MRISVGPGTYVVAVSGGVDSIVLLNLLVSQYKSPVTSLQSSGVYPGDKRQATKDSNRRFVVAHYDHGIREESHKDRKLVRDIARNHGLPFVHEKGNLGPGASEATARKARYDFLRRVQQASGAHAIITAHHEDDMLETAIINLLRGTGRRGLAALKNHTQLLRPLLPYGKDRIRDYAKMHGLQWREDPSNQDVRLVRNYVRHRLLTKFSPGQRAQLRIILEELTEINNQIDVQLENLLHVQPARDMLDRRWFIGLPHAVAREVAHAWLRQHGVRNITKKTIERAVVAMKTGKYRQQADIDRSHKLHIRKHLLALELTER